MKIALEVISVRSSYIEGLSDVILIDHSSNTVICIPIGEFEARLIALSVEKKDLPKPMMFESFVSIISYFGVEVKYVLIDSARAASSSITRIFVSIILFCPPNM